MKQLFRIRSFLFVTFAGILMQPAFGQDPSTWQDEFAKMPLKKGVTELSRTNCVTIFMEAFKRNPAVKGVIFMPGATDEFYFFRRAHAKLTNDAPTLLDAVVALTNQTYIRAMVLPPFLLLRTDQDPKEPLADVQDQKTLDSIKKHKYAKEAKYSDRDWDYVRHELGYYLNITIKPPPKTHESNHFFRNSLVAYDLDGWEALEAMALAGKTTFTVTKRTVTFAGDERFYGKPPMDGFFLLQPH